MQLKHQFYLLMLVIGICNGANAQSSASTSTGNLNLDFKLMVGAQRLQINGEQVYQNALGEKFNLTLFNFFVSNIKLKTRAGVEYVVPQNDSYFLVRANDSASQVIQLKGVPSADYSEISFLIGVDSLRNTMDISLRTGVLDPAFGEREANMYWSWNSGYIFVKMEGLSAQAKVDRAGNAKFRYHIGGFGGMISKSINNIRSVSRSFNGQVATVGKETQTTVNIQVDAAKLFDGPTQLSIAKNTTVMSGEISGLIANNYVNMFQIGQIVNPKAQ
jgi:hypothetical protein